MKNVTLQMPTHRTRGATKPPGHLNSRGVSGMNQVDHRICLRHAIFFLEVVHRKAANGYNAPFLLAAQDAPTVNRDTLRWSYLGKRQRQLIMIFVHAPIIHYP